MNAALKAEDVDALITVLKVAGALIGSIIGSGIAALVFVKKILPKVLSRHLGSIGADVAETRKQVQDTDNGGFRAEFTRFRNSLEIRINKIDERAINSELNLKAFQAGAISSVQSEINRSIADFKGLYEYAHRWRDDQAQLMQVMISEVESLKYITRELSHKVEGGK